MPKFMTIVRGSEKHAEPPPALQHFPSWDCEVEIRQMMDEPAGL